MYEKGPRLQQLFDQIAPRYDLTNALLSLGLHLRWNRALCRVVSNFAPKNLLDVCAGTGAIGLALGRNCPSLRQITLLDYSAKMLDIAKKKYSQNAHLINSDVLFLNKDAMQLKSVVSPNHFDAVCMAYGLRNVEDPFDVICQIGHVLKPGGIFAILELTRPQNSFLRAMHRAYLRCLPCLGNLMTCNFKAYRYLIESVEGFCDARELAASASRLGFAHAHVRPLCYGAATLLVFGKSP